MIEPLVIVSWLLILPSKMIKAMPVVIGCALQVASHHSLVTALHEFPMGLGRTKMDENDGNSWEL